LVGESRGEPSIEGGSEGEGLELVEKRSCCWRGRTLGVVMIVLVLLFWPVIDVDQAQQEARTSHEWVMRDTFCDSASLLPRTAVHLTSILALTPFRSPPVSRRRDRPASQPGDDLTSNVEAKRGPVHSDTAESPLLGRSFLKGKFSLGTPLQPAAAKASRATSRLPWLE